MSRKYLLSIIVPIYNTAEYLYECIESILTQTYSNIELILIDDGSTDESAWICDGFAQKDLRVIVKHTQHLGASSARNIGILLAKGKYIAFVDSDDILHKQMYEILLEALERNDVDFSFAIIKRMFGRRFVNQCTDEEIMIEGDNIVKAHFGLHDRIFIEKSMCDKVFKRELLSDLTFLEGLRQGEDNLFLTQILLKCKKCVFVGKELYFYRNVRNGNSNSKNTVENIFTDKIPARKKILQMLREEGYEKNVLCEQKKLYDDYLIFFKQIKKSDRTRKRKKVLLQMLNTIVLEDWNVIMNTGRTLKWRVKWYLYLFVPHLLNLIINLKAIISRKKD